MDGSAIDRATRAFWETASRRGMLRGLAAAILLTAARPRTASAQSGPSPSLGLACSDDVQCVQGDYHTVVCADNGIAGDGPRNCCVAEGWCQADADCCGAMLCAPGYESRYCAYPGFATQGVGDACAAGSECVSSAAGIVACGMIGGSPACCFQEGAFCSNGTSCCDGLICAASRCRMPGDAGQVVLDPCAYDAQCSQASGAAICGTSDRGAGTCCRIENQPCGHWDACCRPLSCNGGVCRY